MITLAEDKLQRKEFILDLFNIFDNFGNYDDGGLTIAINGKYGSGKSTLLNFIMEENNTENKYYIVKYDAWQNNIFDNPLIPILYALNSLNETSNKIKECAKNVIKSLPKILVNTLANIHGIDLSALVTNENIFDDYKKHTEIINKYKNNLANFCKEKKIILLIDELDRCLPRYQIKVLETLYNIFNIPNLILLIALDKSQLKHSVKQIFGNQENVSGYLSKFIQYEIDLPENKNNKYLESLLAFNCEYPEIKEICAKMFEKANISIRSSMQIVKELNLICNEKRKDGQPFNYIYWYPLFVCLVLIIKNQNKDIYKKYFYEDLPFENSLKLPLEQTKYYDFLSDIKHSPIENIIKYFISPNMNFGFIIYFINYFHTVSYITMESLTHYTNYSEDRIQALIHNYEKPMWNYNQFNKTLSKIRVFK